MKLIFCSMVIGATLTFTFNSFAQSTQLSQETTEQKVKALLSEVYLNCPEYVHEYNIQEGVKLYNRIIIHKVPLGEYPDCLTLSSVSLRNKCNAQLSYDNNAFDPEKFNPFKYSIKSHSTNVGYYRVDGADFIIEIKPIN